MGHVCLRPAKSSSGSKSGGDESGNWVVGMPVSCLNLTPSPSQRCGKRQVRLQWQWTVHVTYHIHFFLFLSLVHGAIQDAMDLCR